MAHRGDHPLLCLNPDGRLLPEVGPAVQRKSNTCDLHGTVPIPMEMRHWLHGLHDDPWDNVWVTDVGRHLVMKFDPAGILIATFGHDGEHGCSDRLFYQPTHVSILPTGGFFVADGYGNSRIIKFSATGRRRLEWGTRGTAPGEFHTPHVITLGRDGLLYVSDRRKDRVQVFDSEGSLRAEWSGLHSVNGLHAAPDGRIYGAAGLDNAIVEFDSQGRPAQVWAKPGFFCYPHCLTLDAAGTIYVAEIAGNRGATAMAQFASSPHEPELVIREKTWTAFCPNGTDFLSNSARIPPRFLLWWHSLRAARRAIRLLARLYRFRSLEH